MIDDKTALGWPLPHPNNDPFAVDVPRLREALTLIDAAISAARVDLGARPTATAVDGKIKSAIDALKGAAPEAFDTLVEIAAKLASNDDAVAALLAQLATKASQVGVDEAVSALITRIGALEAGALMRSGGTMTGAINFAPGQVFPGVDLDLIAAVPTIRKDLLLTALQVASGDGVRLRMSAGIIDPYQDQSGISLTEALFDPVNKAVPLRQLPGFQQFTWTGKASNPSSIEARGSGSVGEGSAYAIFDGSQNNFVYWRMGAGWFEGTCSTPGLFRSVEIVIYSQNGSGSPQNTTLTFTEPGGGAVVATYALTLPSGDGIIRKVIDFSQPLTNGVRITSSAAISGFMNYVRPLASKAADFVNAASITGFGRTWGHFADGAFMSGTLTSGSGAPYEWVADMGVARKLRAIGMYGHVQDRWLCFQVSGSNDNSNWTVLGQSIQTQSSYYGSSSTIIPFNAGIAYRYYRINLAQNSAGYTDWALRGFSFMQDGDLDPTLLSTVLGADAVPSKIRLGIQCVGGLANILAEVSRNNGAAWKQMTFGSQLSPAAGYDFAEGLVDVSDQPSGSAVRYRIRTKNKASVTIAGAILQWS